MALLGVHHVAYRCINALQTVKWYEHYLNMRFVLAISESHVPSTGAFDPYMHVFLDAGGNNILAFFELLNSRPMGRDPNTPPWVQHIAFKVDSLQSLFETQARLTTDGIEVIGVIDHGLFKSIYFFDPNGHRIELCFDDANPSKWQAKETLKWTLLHAWDAQHPGHTSSTAPAPSGGASF
jgi:lactoylglutathione lyase